MHCDVVLDCKESKGVYKTCALLLTALAWGETNKCCAASSSKPHLRHTVVAAWFCLWRNAFVGIQLWISLAMLSLKWSFIFSHNGASWSSIWNQSLPPGCCVFFWHRPLRLWTWVHQRCFHALIPSACEDMDEPWTKPISLLVKQGTMSIEEDHVIWSGWQYNCTKYYKFHPLISLWSWGHQGSSKAISDGNKPKNVWESLACVGLH